MSIDNDIDMMQGKIEGRCPECGLVDEKHHTDCSHFKIDYESMVIPMIRKTMPKLIAHELAGVQPMGAMPKDSKMKVTYNESLGQETLDDIEYLRNIGIKLTKEDHDKDSTI